jgi:hypothetical protein
VKARYAYVVLDGTLIPVDRVAADRPFYSGKHKRHGMNLQVIAGPGGDILGAALVTFGAIVIGPRSIVTRARQIAECVTKASRS